MAMKFKLGYMIENFGNKSESDVRATYLGALGLPCNA